MAGSRRRARRRHRRRPPAPGVHGLPSGALDRGARRAHPPPARRPDHRRDRARLPGPGADHRPAHRPGQEDARRERGPRSRSRAAPSSPRACRRCSRSSTSSSTRATRRPPATTGCDLRSARMRCASAASWPSSCRQEPEVHGLVALMEIQASRSRGTGRPVRSAHPAPRPEPRALGPAPHPPRSRRARARREARRRARALRAAGRDRRLPRAGAHSGGDRLACASRRSTERSPGSRHPPSSSSIGRSPWRWPSVLRRASSWSTN